MKTNLIEKGQVLEINSTIRVKSDSINGMYVTIMCDKIDIPIGNIMDKDQTWFKQSPTLRPENIKCVVFLGDFCFGVKQLTDIFDEFNALSKETQEMFIIEALQNIEQIDQLEQRGIIR